MRRLYLSDREARRKTASAILETVAVDGYMLKPIGVVCSPLLRREDAPRHVESSLRCPAWTC